MRARLAVALLAASLALLALPTAAAEGPVPCVEIGDGPTVDVDPRCVSHQGLVDMVVCHVEVLIHGGSWHQCIL